MRVAAEVRILDGAAALFRAAAEAFVMEVETRLKSHERFSVALSGGATPSAVYALLAAEPLRNRLPWGAIHFFWGDERHVPPDHPDSNYRMTDEALLSKVPVPPGNIHRIQAEDADPHRAARAYEATMRAFFGVGPRAFPRFDLVLLGLGLDGHTASLFPGTPALREMKRLAVATRVERLSTDRITLTVPVFNHAACVTFVVSGAEKAPALKVTLEGPYRPDERPAQLIQPQSGRLVFLVDREAAGRPRQ